MRFSLFFLLLLIFSISATQPISAQEVMVKRSSVIENYKGKPYYIHFVSSGETLNSISHAYNITVEELRAENPAIQKGLKADMVLRIPQKAIVAIPEAEIQVVEKVNDPIKPSVTPKEKPSVSNTTEYTTYLVKKQETLYGISKQFNVTVDDIVNTNPGFEGLKEGMELKIPVKKGTVKTVTIDTPAVKTSKSDTNRNEIVVKTGETLYSIAKIYNTTVDNLIDLNPQLTGGLKAGMILVLRKPETNTVAKPSGKPNAVTTVNTVVPGDCFNDKNIKTTYQVALLLPFLLEDAAVALEATEQKDPSEFESFNYFQFYAGFMLAADSLEKLGLRARIQVLDADKLNDTLTIRQTLRKPGLEKMDLLIGPMYANSFTVAARFAQKNRIGIINPLSRRESIVEGNPFVIKTQASGSGISAKLTSFILRNYPGANIISVRNDKKEFKTLADEFSANIKAGIASHSFAGTMYESVFATDMMAGVTKKLKPDVKNIIIFFSNNKTNVPNFVSLLNPLSKSNDIILIGMDGWDELELETEFLVNLNFHQLTSNYVDYESEAVQQFNTRFQNKYGAVPLSGKHAFLGFDIGWYFLTSLMWYGDKYMECLPSQKGVGLQYDFNFAGDGSGDGLQNQDITIVKLQDYKMVKVE